MNGEVKQSIKEAAWEAVVSVGAFVAGVLMFIYPEMFSVSPEMDIAAEDIEEVGGWVRGVLLGGICLSTGLATWGQRHIGPGETRVGLLRAVLLLCAVAVGLTLLLSCAEMRQRAVAVALAFVGMGWLLCYMGRGVSVGQSVKEAWRLGCTVLMWWFSVACLCICGRMILELVELLQVSVAGVAPVVAEGELLPEDAAFATYCIALVFFFLGGGRGHSPLVFNHYASVWVFITLMVVYNITLLVLLPGHRLFMPFTYMGLVFLAAYAGRCTR